MAQVFALVDQNLNNIKMRILSCDLNGSFFVYIEPLVSVWKYAFVDEVADDHLGATLRSDVEQIDIPLSFAVKR